MTTAFQTAQPTSHDPAPSGTRRLRLVGETAHDGADGRAAAPLVGYLLLVPEGTDPAELFVEDRPRPEIRPVLATDPPPARPAEEDAVRIDPVRRTAEVDGRELDLTYLEFELLARLVRHPHRVHSRDGLVSAVWGYDHIGDGRTVDVHVARLRRKLGRAHRHRIVTVRRVGYKYVPDRAESAGTPPRDQP